ncbi:MAG: AAA family ATPase [Flavobacteriales bacterium]|nr:AAA family ATPase [Flavobacteriales bacterium]
MTLIYANAKDDGFAFIFPRTPMPQQAEPEGKGNAQSGHKSKDGGLVRESKHGHLATIVGRGGTGKSILALQLITSLLENANKKDQNPKKPAAAFYFTLESSVAELKNQMDCFEWGKEYSKNPAEKGLHIIQIPSPAEDLTALLLQIRQYIARKLTDFGELSAIVIDALGGILLMDDLRNDLSQLKNLTDNHETFLFLLTEDHIFTTHPSIEHYSQSVIHLQHNSENQGNRTLSIQKARGQLFRSGFHQFDLKPKIGIKIYPSVQAQSAYAHEKHVELKSSGSGDLSIARFLCTLPPHWKMSITPGSVSFLMGPPGTFKQQIAAKFCKAFNPSIYISFKADIDSVNSVLDNGQSFVEITKEESSQSNYRFVDVRSPLRTPEEILTEVRQAVQPDNTKLKSAVIWGLRRLADMPNFSGSKSVQFLEALVTILKAEGITSLLVDWPDPDKANVLPIVDLSQYIFLTRPCKGYFEFERDSVSDSSPNPYEATQKAIADEVWYLQTDETERVQKERVVLLRIQRDNEGFHRDRGILISKRKDEKDVSMEQIPDNYFEKYWELIGNKWEKDPSLL